MMNPPAAPSDDVTTPPAMNLHRDNATMATPSHGRNAKPKGPEFTEITVKFCFTALESSDHVAPEVLHLHWLQIAQDCRSTEEGCLLGCRLFSVYWEMRCSYALSRVLEYSIVLGRMLE